MTAAHNIIKTQWATSFAPVAYKDALGIMEARIADIHAGNACELVWALEHPPLITAGTSAKQKDLLRPDQFEVFQSGRGGQFTYHGPGQRVVYVMMDLTKRGRNIRAFVQKLEQWLIGTLAEFDLPARRYDDRVGVWVDCPGANGTMDEAKIAAIGLRIRRWISFHGVSLNVNPDLSHFEAIVPCGIADHGVSSLAALGKPHDMKEVDRVLRQQFIEQFGPVATVKAPLP